MCECVRGVMYVQQNCFNEKGFIQYDIFILLNAPSESISLQKFSLSNPTVR